MRVDEYIQWASRQEAPVSDKHLIRAGAQAANHLSRLVGTRIFGAAMRQAKVEIVYNANGRQTSLAALWATSYAADVEGGSDLVFGDMDLLRQLELAKHPEIGEALFRLCTFTANWDSLVEPVGITREQIARWIVARLRWENANSPTLKEMDRRQKFYEVLLTGDPIYRDFLVKHKTLGEVIDILRQHVTSSDLQRVQLATWELRHGRKF